MSTIVSIKDAAKRRSDKDRIKRVAEGEMIKRNLKLALVETLKYHGINAVELEGMATLLTMVNEVVDHHTGSGSEIMEVINNVVEIQREIDYLNGTRMI